MQAISLCLLNLEARLGRRGPSPATPCSAHIPRGRRRAGFAPWKNSMCSSVRLLASNLPPIWSISMTHYSNAPRRQGQERDGFPSVSSSRRAISRPRSAITARPVLRARAAAGQPKEPAPPGPSCRKLRAPCASSRRKSNHAGGSRRAIRLGPAFCRPMHESRLQLAGVPLPVGIRAAHERLHPAVHHRRRRSSAGSKPATSTRNCRRRASARRAAAIALK